MQHYRLLHYYGFCWLLTVRCYSANDTAVRPPRLRCVLFPLIYPPHLLLLPATFGLHLLLQTYPYFRALYVISVRRTKSLPTASFRFHLTVDTLAVQLCASSLPRRTWDFHPLEPAHGGQTKRAGSSFWKNLLLKHSFYPLTGFLIFIIFQPFPVIFVLRISTINSRPPQIRLA